MNKYQRWLLWTVATLPMALMLAALARGLYVDYRAWVEVSPVITREAGKAATFYLAPHPTSVTLGNDASTLSNMAAAIRVRADQSGIELSANSAYGVNPSLINLPQGGEWPAPEMDQIIDHARPFFAKIDELVSRADVPYDLSILLREESSVLHLRFYAALQRKDSDELYRALQTFAAMLRKPQTAPDANSQEVYARTVELRTFHLIRDFLQNYRGTDQSRFFDVISEILRPLDVEKRLSAAHETMPLMMLTSVSRFNDPIELTSSRFTPDFDWANFRAALALLNETASIRVREQLPYVAQQSRAPRTVIEENLFSFSTRNAETNYNNQRYSLLRLAISLWRLEDARRVLLLGLAARHYEAAHVQLPQSIDELLSDPQIPEGIRKALHRTSIDGQPFDTDKLDFESQDVFCINSHSQAWSIGSTDVFTLNRIVLTPTTN